MRRMSPRVLVVLPLLLGLDCAAAEPLDWFSSELRRARRLRAELAAELQRMGPPQLGQTAPQLGYQHLQVRVPPLEPAWVQLDLGTSQPIDRVALIPATTEIQPPDRGPYGFPREFRVDVSDVPDFSEFTPVYAQSADARIAPGFAPVVFQGGVQGRYVRVTVSRFAEENGWHFFALAEIMLLRGNRNLALGAAVSASSIVRIEGRWAPEFLVDGRTPLGPPIRRAPLAEFDALFAGPTAAEPLGWMSVDLGSPVAIEEVRLHPLHSWQGADVPGFRFPVRFRIEVSDTADFVNPRAFFTTGPGDFPHPGNNPVTCVGEPVKGRYVRVLCSRPVPSARNDFALSELEVYAAGKRVSAGRPVNTSDLLTRERPRPAALLTDGLTSLGQLVEWPEWLDDWQRRSEVALGLADLDARLPELEQTARRRAGYAAGAVSLALALALGAGTIVARRRREAEQHRFRTQLARDLHDEIGSNLAGIAVLSETAAIRSAHADPAVAPEFREIQRIALESADAMREVLWLVGARQEGGVELAHHLRRAAGRLLPGIDIVWQGLPEVFPSGWSAEARRELFLFCKEALTNVARHARATRVQLAFTFRPQFELVVEDNGVGFDPAGPSGGVGLASLRARAAALGGSLQIESAPARGTRLVLRAPAPSA
jgi:signal transduction histidine kinase